MRMIVDGTEPDLAIASVVVDGQVHKSLVAGARYEAMNELWRKGAVANRTWNVITALAREMNLPHAQCKLSSDTRRAGKQNRTVLIIVSRKEVIADNVKVLPRHPETACLR